MNNGYDGNDSFLGNLELQYDDGAKGISNSWQCELIISTNLP